MLKTAFFQRYLLPGFVFQSVVIAGGYGTGRELVEFFLTLGPVGGLLAMLLVSTVIWSAVCATSFEFARVFRSYDYRSFFMHLLGRGWWLFEVCYFGQLLIVLAVIAAAAGAILRETLALPYVVGVVGMMAAVGFLTFRGSKTIERFLAAWSFLLYGIYVVFFVWCFRAFGDDILASFTRDAVQPGWLVGGVKYAAYNLATVPAVLFCVNHITTRREAVSAGMLAGVIAIVPGLLFFLAMTGQYPAILDRPVPANMLLEILGSRGFQLLFQVVLFGTLIETGTGMIHAVNERIAAVYREEERPMPRLLRPAIALGLLVMGTLVAQFGLINLIAKGYGTLTWLFLVVFVVPVLTVGIWKIRRRSGDATAPVSLEVSGLGG